MATKEQAPVYLVRKGNALFPELQMDLERLQAIPNGRSVRVELKQPRSNERLRLYWRMLSYVREATDCAPTSEYLHSAIKLELGFGTPVRLRNGMTVLVPSSVAFDKMEEPEFHTFFNKAVEFLTSTYGFDVLGFYNQERAA